MLKSIKDIHEHIQRDAYCNHPGKRISQFIIKDQDLKEYNTIKSFVNEYGFGILNIENKRILYIIKLLQKIFGSPIKNVGINKTFIVKVEYSKLGKHYINSSFSQPLHTDEGYRNEFPRYVSLYCIKPSQIGGVSTIVKVQDILTKLFIKFGNDVNYLFQSSNFHIESPYEKLKKHILFELDKNVIGMSYTPVLRNIATTELGYEMLHFVNQYIHDPSNQYRVQLQKNDLLIMDNCQILHGRTAYDKSESRILLRFWNELVKI